MLASEADRLREIRLRSLATDPSAFVTTFEGDSARPASWWERGARLSEKGTERRFVIVDEDDHWLGLALVRPDDESPGDAVINAMWVAPEARRRGAATALCEACVAWAAEHGFPRVNMAATVGNDAALAAYERVGFVRVRVVEGEWKLTRSLA